MRKNPQHFKVTRRNRVFSGDRHVFALTCVQFPPESGSGFVVFASFADDPASDVFSYAPCGLSGSDEVSWFASSDDAAFFVRALFPDVVMVVVPWSAVQLVSAIALVDRHVV
jgi:hypothetical protein